MISWKLSGEKNNSLTATVAAGNETNFFNNNHMQNYLHWTNDLEGAAGNGKKKSWQLSKATFQKNIENWCVFFSKNITFFHLVSVNRCCAVG